MVQGRRVLISDAVSSMCENILRDAGCEVNFSPQLSAEKLLEVIPEYEGLIIRSRTRVTEEVIAAAERLRVVGRAGAGIDNIALDAASSRGIAVFNTAAGNTVSAAEHTFALMLALARKIPQADQATKHGEWNRNAFNGTELFKKTLGIIGIGRIGTEVAKRALAFEMRVIATDPLVPRSRFLDVGVEPCELGQLMQRSDFVTLHVPGGPDTRYLIGEAELNVAKQGLRIVNTARGGLIDEVALARALQAGRIAGAALDVFEDEPPRDSALLACQNVVLTPHIGASTDEAQERVAVQIAQIVATFLHNGEAAQAVNRERLSH